MATKKDRPVAENPLANMGLDDIVRGITTPQESEEKPTEAVLEKTKAVKRRGGKAKKFEENLDKYIGIGEKGMAIWLPKEVKKRLELIRVNSDRTIPIRSLAAAIIMTYIDENEEYFEQL